MVAGYSCADDFWRVVVSDGSSCELLGGSWRRESVDFRRCHRPDCFEPEGGGPEDFPLRRRIGGANGLAQALIAIIVHTTADRDEPWGA